MNHLLRDLAPLSPESWKALEEEATSRLTTHLAARQLVDFSRPLGWHHSAINLGRVNNIEAPASGLNASLRLVQPLVELRSPFIVAREELRALDRGALDVDLASLDAAALAIGNAENASVFDGWKNAAIGGISAASHFEHIKLGTDFSTYPLHVAKAVQLLHSSGVAGPYGLALGSEGYTGVIESTEHGGLIVFDHLREILGGPIVRTPGITGAVVLSLRGGDFLFECGEDLSIGYEAHDETNVHLYFEESFSFRVVTPEAAVRLKT
jgi:uncharacterized linocin/CFP29 family protein